MWESLASASMRIRPVFPYVTFGAPAPALNDPELYGPWTKRSMFHWYAPLFDVSSDSRHTLKVNPEQSPPSPFVPRVCVGSPGELSTSSSFQHPPPHW